MPNLNQKPSDMTSKTRGRKGRWHERAWGLQLSPSFERNQIRSPDYKQQMTLQITQGVTHSESQKCDFKSISKMRLGVAEGRLKFQLVQTFWNIKPWMFGGNSSRKHLCQLPISSSGARIGSTVNKDFKISWILTLDVKDGSQWAHEHPFATVRTKVTFCTTHEHEMPVSCFPTNHFI